MLKNKWINHLFFFSGKSCLDASIAPVDCLAGEYSPGGVTSCTPCADGYYSDSGGASNCTACPEGYGCPDKASSPVSCSAGEYR